MHMERVLDIKSTCDKTLKKYCDTCSEKANFKYIIFIEFNRLEQPKTAAATLAFMWHLRGVGNVATIIMTLRKIHKKNK